MHEPGVQLVMALQHVTEPQPAVKYYAAVTETNDITLMQSDISIDFQWAAPAARAATSC